MAGGKSKEPNERRAEISVAGNGRATFGHCEGSLLQHVELIANIVS